MHRKIFRKFFLDWLGHNGFLGLLDRLFDVGFLLLGLDLFLLLLGGFLDLVGGILDSILDGGLLLSLLEGLLLLYLLYGVLGLISSSLGGIGVTI